MMALLPLLQAMAHRPDGKMYRIHTPQTPLARTHRYDAYKMDEYPNGTNAIVAVLSYTGELFGCSRSTII